MLLKGIVIKTGTVIWMLISIALEIAGQFQPWLMRTRLAKKLIS